jgi:hypothetical protein
MGFYLYICSLGTGHFLGRYTMEGAHAFIVSNNNRPMRKRITKPRRINLDLLYPVASAIPEEVTPVYNDEDFYDDYDPEEEYINLEYKKAIPDGESAFIIAIKNGEDF